MIFVGSATSQNQQLAANESLTVYGKPSDFYLKAAVDTEEANILIMG